ncbi:Predicted D-lactate dehydrogenase, Fe-S protein, FAD/FMN-containing [hydrothermal vent metagenome]|uniref:D-lactate dehydrogenase (cytochrome) n=1 Tax=hydrothermal vent metagenome TaxID=652676 RepID=A0A3B0TW90_9ZZZZ
MNNKKNSGIAVAARLKDIIAPERLKTDPLYTYAYSGDASYFRLVPALVAIVINEEEVRAVMAAAAAENLPITFRAAGTSLSGQAVGDGVLCVLGDGWKNIDISADGDQITLGPGTIVSKANDVLRPFRRKIGPDPASLNICKIGGVVANNSSGMCCGVAQNTYHTMTRLRLILNDGSVLDSGKAASRAAFAAARPDIIEGLKTLAEKTRGDNQLVDLIRKKYEIKNTVGYSLNALIDFDDPIDILTHLMVGSEGTLGFVSQITYNTVPDHPFKATALVAFPTNHIAAQGVQALYNVGVSAAEFIERKALATVEHLPAMKPFLPLLSETSPAVLIEIMAKDERQLDIDIKTACEAMIKVGALSEPVFYKEVQLQAGLWDVRKGLFASVGSSRPQGSLMLTEDVAVPIDQLAAAVDDLRLVLDRNGFEDGIIFGHALAGNLHFQMHADFTVPGELARFEKFSAELAKMVSVDYQGSLKAEHGTGRAVAPFVEQEWGKKAYWLMHAIKELLDPENLLNPGVLLNDDDKAHISHIKQMPASDKIIDLCIECGLCEPACPSAGLTLSPRQRIAVIREQARLELTGGDNDLLQALKQGFFEAGMDLCAACNLCSISCPIDIETGTMILGRRQRKQGGFATSMAALAAKNTPAIEGVTRLVFAARQGLGKLGGDKFVDNLGGTLNRVSAHKIAKISKSLRPGPGAPRPRPKIINPPLGNVIYFPACASRMFGAPKTELNLLPVTEAIMVLLERAGFNPVLPKKLAGQCCGQPFLSKGFPDQAGALGNKLSSNLAALADKNNALIITDMSSCALHMQQDGVLISDSVEFLAEKILPHLSLDHRIDQVALHHNCAAQHLGEQKAMAALASACAENVAVLSSVTCCGFAGDKGLYHPELNAHATRFAKDDLPKNCTIGVSSSASCAAGLSGQLAIDFVSVASLLEYVSRP